MRTKIKICGLRTVEAIRTCVSQGVDAIGFVFYPSSPRSVTAQQAGELALKMGVWQTPVGLFVNPAETQVKEVIEQIPMVLLQFHGDESAAFCESFNRPYIKAIRMRPGVDLIKESAQYACAQALLVDSWNESYGGSGHVFDWSLLTNISQMKQALVLSGGLDAANVSQAISKVRPCGVDVSSGVELSKGVKSTEKIIAFCHAVNLADAQNLQHNIQPRAVSNEQTL